jgi:aldehyde dehydrogenase (NAD+)
MGKQHRVEGAALYFEYHGNQASTVEGTPIPLGKGFFGFADNVLFGVSAQIIPWNYPIEMTARSLSAALATGNACVIKSPELRPLTNAWFGHAAEAVGLPAGAVNLLCGLGQEAGAALAGHSHVNRIGFTGSGSTGIAIATAAARAVGPCVLAPGGKSAAISHDDADPAAFENDIRWGIYFDAGQVCSAMSRVFVHQSHKEKLLQRAEAVAKSLSVGPGADRISFGANMGAMVSEAQRDRAESMVRRAEEQGARLVTGGPKLNRPWAFLGPIVLADVSPDMDIASTEVFGPVLSVLSFHEDAEVIEIAHGTDHGLLGGVLSRDLDRATQAARLMRAGQVFVNEWYAGGVETPFGGFGKSGYGREKGREALWNYVQTKNVAINLA